jgi:hypothetical protein
MKRLLIAFLIFGAILSSVFAQSIVTPVFVHKDGDAAAAGYSGTEKDIYVDGGAQQSVGWVTFQTQGIDMSKIASAKLLLYVKALSSPGTLQVRLLTSDITAPEKSVALASIPSSATVTASLSLGTADIEKMAQIDLTAAVKSGTFWGVALTSDDGVALSFDSKEGHLAPMIMLTNDVGAAAAKWLSGTSAPAATLGKDGDYYLNTATGDVSAKSSGAWSVVTNIVGPTGAQGSKGDQGDQGIQGLTGATGATGSQGSKGDKGDIGDKGPKGDQGDAGATGLQGLPGAQGPQGLRGHSPVSTSKSVVTIPSVGQTARMMMVENRLAFSAGQQIRVCRTDSSIWFFFDAAVESYDTATGDCFLKTTFSKGAGRRDSSWLVMATGVSGSSSWKDSAGGVFTSVNVGIGAAGSDPLTVEGRMTLHGRDGSLKFSDNSVQTTGYIPSENAGAAEVQALRDSLLAMKTRLASIESLLQHFSRSGNEVFIVGANLNIRSGAASTAATVNGLGNLVVGYNEARSAGSNKTGSHNIVVGEQNNYSSYGGLVAGINNTVSGEYASVSGGASNTASGGFSSISGGNGNTADAASSSVSGGIHNYSGGSFSSVSGGYYNTANGHYSSVSGGWQDTATGIYSWAAGGRKNKSRDSASSVSGGYANVADTNYASVNGGAFNTAIGWASNVGGGYGNIANGGYASASGGWLDTASGLYSWAAGGRQNASRDTASAVSGGYKNRADSSYASVSGGYINTAKGWASSVSGGFSNKADSSYASVSGGGENTASGRFSSVSGGVANIAKGWASSVSGGVTDTASGDFCSVSGGENNNAAAGRSSSVSGGYHNQANGFYSSVSGGDGNEASGTSSSVSGGDNNDATGYHSSVSGGQNRTENRSYQWTGGDLHSTNP